MTQAGPPWHRANKRFLSEDERRHLAAAVKANKRFKFCEICGLEMLPGERRDSTRRLHLDCEISYLEHLDEEHRA
jgi:hypothetical protein